MNTDGKVKKESKYKITAKGINTINFYSFNFGFIDHEEAVMYCCLLQEAERFDCGWFFWKEKDKMQYGRKTYDRLRDRLCEKGLIQVINGGYNNRQNFLVNYDAAIDHIETLFKEHQQAMVTYLEEAKQKQKIKVQSQTKLNVKSGYIEIQVENVEEQIEDHISIEVKDKAIEQIKVEDSIQKEKATEQQQQQTIVQLNEEKDCSIDEQEQQAALPAIPIQLNQDTPYVQALIEYYPCLNTRANFPDQYLMTDNQKGRLRKELKRISIADADVDVLLTRIKEYRVGRGAGSTIVKDVIAYVEDHVAANQQNGTAIIQSKEDVSDTAVKRSTTEEVKQQLDLIPHDLIDELIKDIPEFLNQYTSYKERDIPQDNFEFDHLRKSNFPKLELDQGQIAQLIQFMKERFFGADLLYQIAKKTRILHEEKQQQQTTVVIKLEEREVVYNDDDLPF